MTDENIKTNESMDQHEQDFLIAQYNAASQSRNSQAELAWSTINQAVILTTAYITAMGSVFLFWGTESAAMKLFCATILASLFQFTLRIYLEIIDRHMCLENVYSLHLEYIERKMDIDSIPLHCAPARHLGLLKKGFENDTNQNNPPLLETEYNRISNSLAQRQVVRTLYVYKKSACIHSAFILLLIILFLIQANSETSFIEHILRKP